VWLGPEGKSGIWIKRSLNELTIFVVVAPFDRSCPVESGDDMRELYDVAPQIEPTGEILSINGISGDLRSIRVRCRTVGISCG
jgi:hypothetical protein